MRKTLESVLGADLTRVCLCGPAPQGTRAVEPREILGVLGAIQAAGHDHEAVLSMVRTMDGGKMSGFVLDPDLNHYGTCVPAEMLLLAVERMRGV